MALRRMMLTMVLGLLSFVLVFGQNTTVKGQVKSNLGNNVADVVVVVAGDSINATTDLDGRFEIKVASADVIMVFEKDGYKRISVACGGKKELKIEMILEDLLALALENLLSIDVESVQKIWK